MKKIEIGNLKMGYVIIGDGPLVVLLHGYGGNHLDWMTVVEGLAEGYTYLIVNYKNFFLQKENINFSAQQIFMMRFVHKIIDEHNLNSEFHLISTSYGSALGLSLQSQLSESVLSHIMVNPMPYNPLAKLRSFPVKVLMKVSRNDYLFKKLIKTSIGKKYLEIICDIFGLGKLSRFLEKKNDLRKVVYIRRAIENFYYTVKGENWKPYYEQLGRLDDSDMVAYISLSDELFSKESYNKLLEKLESIKVCYISGAGHLVIKKDPSKIIDFINHHLAKYIDFSEKTITKKSA